MCAGGNDPDNDDGDGELLGEPEAEVGPEEQRHQLCARDERQRRRAHLLQSKAGTVAAAEEEND